MRNPRRKLYFRPIFFALFVAHCAHAQIDTEPMTGLGEASPRFFAITGAKVWQGSGADAAWVDATVVLQDGRIASVLRSQNVPAGATAIDASGKYLLPGFIDLVNSFGAGASSCKHPQAMSGGGGRMPAAFRSAQSPLAAEGARARYWNPTVCAELRHADSLSLDADAAKALRAVGVTNVVTASDSGVWRGSSALLALRIKPTPGNTLLRDRVVQTAAMQRSAPFSGNYPASTMGAVALLRQSLFDASWYQSAKSYAEKNRTESPAANDTLAALAPVLSGAQPVFWRTESELDYQRVLNIGREFKLRSIVIGNGFEYRKRDQLKALQAAGLVLPVAFPEAPDVSDPEAVLDIALADMAHWQLAPFNPKLLADAGIEFAIASHSVEKPEQFLANVRKAVRYGLSEQKAIAALTSTPAKLIGASNELGAIASDQRANLLIVDGDFLRDDSAQIYEVFVDGEREIISALDAPSFAGKWQLNLPGGAVKEIKVKGQGSKASVELVELEASASADSASGEAEAKSFESAPASSAAAPDDTLKKDSISAQFFADRVLLQVPGAWLKRDESKLTLTARFVRNAQGRIDPSVWDGSFLLDGISQSWQAKRLAGESASDAAQAGKKDDKAAQVPTIDLAELSRYPAGEFGLLTPPRVESTVFRQATVWLPGFDEKGQLQAPLKNTDVWIKDGRIAAVGSALKVPSAVREIDAQNLHITPGLIDAHSHIAVEGDVNEGTHTVTSEVRIGDVLDPTDINIYRQLAGGVTTSHLLHGSANTIGGQSQVIKLRWGLGADALKFEQAAPTIKLALGENPKQSNWGEQFTTRYPQTRMGVEQLLLDSFNRADAYQALLNTRANNAPPQRTDLRLAAIAEVIAKQRMLHVHSYRQDEILMFARMMQARNIPIAAFQHVLEGYKVADVLAEVGAGASTFSDWWAFKMEVQDAIPHNARLMMKAGVLTSLNSDSPDTARRLNTEAAKAVRFGGLTETEALSLVTINPAKQLRVESLVGTIEVGKQADLVLWSASPLSTQARPLQTWIDGARYFDAQAHQAELKRINQARASLVQAALDAKPSAPGDGPPGKGPGGRKRPALFAMRVESWPAALLTRRSLYHNGQPAHQCTREVLEQMQ